jgi:hypothetical protein
MPKECPPEDKTENIRDKYRYICDYIYCFLPIVFVFCLLIIVVTGLYNIYSQLCTKQTGYLLASLLLILGLLGLWLDNISLYQQQSFKLLICVSVFIFILTFCFSITVDILKIIKDKNSFSVLTQINTY